MLLLFIEIGHFVYVINGAIHLNSNVTLLADALEYRLVLALSRADDGRYDEYLRSFGQIEHAIHDLIYALPFYGPAADGAMRAADARVKEP